ncbi:MAG: 4-hydroxybenzoate octaprenyltransferase, partial [Elusimicrobia bacterium]|nr:4-hydroxybenzoate octaprenyltransferase [Elusimicrobiota bacterium]
MIKNYAGFVKIEHTLFSLPIVFAGTGMAFAFSQPPMEYSWGIFFWIFLAVLGARSYGFGVNRWLDSAIDSQNPRTKDREIPSGKISLRSAKIFVLSAAAIFLFSAYRLSPLCFFLAPIPLILFTIYPFLKRVTIFSHLGLGLAWGVAPIGGWVAVRPHLFPLSEILPVLLLSLFCIFWVAGFDIVYALLDEDFDRQAGLFSLPAVLGRTDALRVSELFHLIAFLTLGTLTQIYLRDSLSFLLLFLV